MSPPVAIVDFETRSECDLRKCGAWVYSRHPSTEILCLAYKIGDGPTRLWTPDDADLRDLFAHIRGGGLVEAHNAFFERCIWDNVLAKHFDCKFDPRQWRCSAARAARYGLPRQLESVCKVLGLPVQKDTKGHALMLKMCKPRRPTKKNKARWHETPDDLRRLYAYCIQDVEAEYAVSKALPPMEPRELALWQLTMEMDWRGVYCDTDFASNAIRCLEIAKADADEQLRRLTGNKVKTCRQVTALRDWIAGKGVNLPDLTKGSVADALQRRLPMSVRRALQIRQAFSRSSVSKFEAMSRRADPDDQRIRDHVRYYGAHTGRWAGQGIQTQNYPGLRGRKLEDVERAMELAKTPHAFLAHYPDPTDMLAAALRPTLCAPPGKVLVCADYKSIEAVILLWLCGKQDMLDNFANGGDIYCDMASQIYGREISEDDKAERTLGKLAVLGLGYGMGVARFAETCEGLEVTAELLERTVQTFRQNIIGGFWRGLERAVINCAASGTDSSFSHFKVRKEDPFLYLKLPSGREITYFKPEVRLEATPWGEDRTKLYYRTEDSQSRKWAWTSTWGGKLTENVVQAIARDVIADASLRLQHPLIMTVHDELVIESDRDCLDELVHEMCRPIDWAPGLPTLAKGWVGRRYRK